MKKIMTLLLFAFVLTLQVKSQERAYLQGICNDDNGKPIENVSVYVHDSLLVSVTDDNGRFTCWNAKVGEKLRFAHMGYEPIYYIVKDKDLNGKNLKINMKTKSHELLEVEISANAPHKTYDNPVMSIIDYVVRDDGIYMIVYRRHNSALLHLSFDMDTLHETRIPSRYQQLYKDMHDNIHVISDYQACKIGLLYFEGKEELGLQVPISRKRFYDTYSPIVAASDSVYITGTYFYYNKELGYYSNIPNSDKEPTLLHYIVDEDACDDIWLLLHTGGIGNNFWVTDPIYNPIYSINNKFYLLAFTDRETIVFDAVGKELERHPLTFHEYRNWNGEIVSDRRWKHKVLVDKGAKQFYTFFVNDGIYIIKRIDLATGTATAVFDLKNFPFAEKPKIHNGVLYFLYRTGNNKRKALYQVKIGE